MALVECVPNISEGRRADVIDGCASAIRETPAQLLDVSSDPAHHRSVFTFAGDRGAVRAAALALIARAIASIDLRTHQGEHPRLGAVDVVPFVPLEGATMADCVALARDVGAAVAEQHDLPVYLYEEAATQPHRRRLEDIRRGGFEGLAAKLRQPEWAPDFGPARPHPSAGATVIGARMPLIAYNVNLASTDLEIAKSIATAVRQKTPGGLPAVKALGLALTDRHLVQVSMNLVDYRVTSMLAAFDRVRQEAGRRGVAIAGSELVGLVPAAALPASPATDLQLEGFTPDRILEVRLQR